MFTKNYSLQRTGMVKTQLKARSIKDSRVLEAMLHVPREKFVPDSRRAQAYEDRPVPIGEEQTVSQPYMVALMTQSLKLQGQEIVLEVGTGSGYQAAILAEVSKHVYTIERLPLLARKARKTLEDQGYDNVTVLIGDGTLGDTAHAPFDAIIVTAGSPTVPLSLKKQLADKGRLVIPTGTRSYQRLMRITRDGDSFVTENLGGCIFVPLIGDEGWEGGDGAEDLQKLDEEL